MPNARLPALTVEVKGVQDATRFLRMMQNKASDNRPVFKLARRRYSQIVKDVFDKQGAAWGLSAWEDLSDARYELRENARPGFGDRPILIWSGALKKAATATENIETSDAGRRVDFDGSNTSETTYLTVAVEKTSMLVEIEGAKVENQEGKQSGKYRLPARPFWPWNAQTDGAMMTVWNRYWEDILK